MIKSIFFRFLKSSNSSKSLYVSFFAFLTVFLAANAAAQTIPAINGSQNKAILRSPLFDYGAGVPYSYHFNKGDSVKLNINKIVAPGYTALDYSMPYGRGVEKVAEVYNNTAVYLGGMARDMSAATQTIIFVDPAQNRIYKSEIIYVDNTNTRLNPTLTPICIAGCTPGSVGVDEEGLATGATLSIPDGVVTGIAVSATGTIYFADTDNNRIRKMVYDSGASAYRISTIAGGATTTDQVSGVATATQIRKPMGVTLSSDGKFLYFLEKIDNADQNFTYRVRKLNLSTGNISTLAMSSPWLNRATCLAIHPYHDNYLFVGTDNKIIRYINISGESDAKFIGIEDGFGDYTPGVSEGSATTTLIGDAGTNYPVALAFDRIGNLYISEKGNKVVRKVHCSVVNNTFSYDKVSTYIGLRFSSSEYSSNSSASLTVSMNNPGGLAFDDYGNLFAGANYLNRGGSILKAVVTPYSISPTTLPSGLSFDYNTGNITGLASALFLEKGFTVTATNQYGSTPYTFSLTVHDLKITTNTQNLYRSETITVVFSEPIDRINSVKYNTDSPYNFGSSYYVLTSTSNVKSNTLYVFTTVETATGTARSLTINLTLPGGGDIEISCNVTITIMKPNLRVGLSTGSFSSTTRISVPINADIIARNIQVKNNYPPGKNYRDVNTFGEKINDLYSFSTNPVVSWFSIASPTLDDSSIALLSGTPTVAGTYTVVINGANSSGTGTANLILDVIKVQGTSGATFGTITDVMTRTMQYTISFTGNVEGVSQVKMGVNGVPDVVFTAFSAAPDFKSLTITIPRSATLGVNTITIRTTIGDFTKTVTIRPLMPKIDFAQTVWTITNQEANTVTIQLVKTIDATHDDIDPLTQLYLFEYSDFRASGLPSDIGIRLETATGNILAKPEKPWITQTITVKTSNASGDATATVYLKVLGMTTTSPTELGVYKDPKPLASVAENVSAREWTVVQLHGGGADIVTPSIVQLISKSTTDTSWTTLDKTKLYDINGTPGSYLNGLLYKEYFCAATDKGIPMGSSNVISTYPSNQGTTYWKLRVPPNFPYGEAVISLTINDGGKLIHLEQNITVAESEPVLDYPMSVVTKLNVHKFAINNPIKKLTIQNSSNVDYPDYLADSGTYTTSVVPMMPEGLTLDPSNGDITGTPTRSSTNLGDYPIGDVEVYVKARNRVGWSQDQYRADVYLITVGTPETVTVKRFETLDIDFNTSLSQSLDYVRWDFIYGLSSSTAPKYSWTPTGTVNAYGQLQNDDDIYIDINPKTNLGSMPPSYFSAGVHTVTISAKDIGVFTVTVNVLPGTPNLTVTNNIIAYTYLVDNLNTVTITNLGEYESLSVTLSSGTLPQGVNLVTSTDSKTLMITGTPIAPSSLQSYVVSASTVSGVSTQQVFIEYLGVDRNVTTTKSLRNTTATIRLSGIFDSADVAIDGTNTTTLASSSSSRVLNVWLPNELTYDSVHTITLTRITKSGVEIPGALVVTITIKPFAPTLSVTTGSKVAFAANQTIAFPDIVIKDLGDAVTAGSYVITPSLPSGLQFTQNGNDAKISGTPTVASANTTYSVSAYNNGGISTVTFQMYIVDLSTYQTSVLASSSFSVSFTTNVAKLVNPVVASLVMDKYYQGDPVGRYEDSWKEVGSSYKTYVPTATPQGLQTFTLNVELVDYPGVEFTFRGAFVVQPAPPKFTYPSIEVYRGFPITVSYTVLDEGGSPSDFYIGGSGDSDRIGYTYGQYPTGYKIKYGQVATGFVIDRNGVISGVSYLDIKPGQYVNVPVDNIIGKNISGMYTVTRVTIKVKGHEVTDYYSETNSLTANSHTLNADSEVANYLIIKGAGFTKSMTAHGVNTELNFSVKYISSNELWINVPRGVISSDLSLEIGDGVYTVTTSWPVTIISYFKLDSSPIEVKRACRVFYPDGVVSDAGASDNKFILEAYKQMTGVHCEKLTVVDVLGNQIYDFVSTTAAKYYTDQLDLNSLNLPAGTYYYKAELVEDEGDLIKDADGNVQYDNAGKELRTTPKREIVKSFFSVVRANK